MVAAETVSTSRNFGSPVGRSVIAFNAAKHHLGAARELLPRLAAGEAAVWDRVRAIEGVFDVYIGRLTVSGIEAAILGFLDQRGATEESSYRELLRREGRHGHIGSYLDVPLADGSRFTLRLGRDAKGFVHIHPSRHAPETLRAKAATWQTALAVAALSVRLDLSTVHRARERLGLSPVQAVPKSIPTLVALLRGGCPEQI